MCGIAGEIRRLAGNDPLDATAVRRVNDAQRHRGPDGEGVWSDGRAVLGHRRLTILDLSDAAAQPLRDPATGVALTFNGEIYNYMELRAVLENRGHRFRSSGDTEVLLRGYLEFGTGILAQLNGMYAFAIWDPRHQELFAARDPAGQKPFIYYHGLAGLVFASELAALLRHPQVPRAIDHAALARYLAFEYYMAPETAISGVHKLPPGHALIYRPDEDNLRIWAHWDPLLVCSELGVPADPGEADMANFDRVLKAAVARHLRSDVPVGVYLSGGIDSTTVAFLAANLLEGDVNTYTVRIADASYDEADTAKATAALLGTRHHEMTLTPTLLLAGVQQLLQTMDEPLADLGLVAVSKVAAFAAQHVKVVLSGDGSDEFFYGYEPFLKWRLSEILETMPNWLINDALKPLLRPFAAQYGYMGLFYKANIFLRGYGRPRPLRNIAWSGAYLPDEIAEVLLDGKDMPALRPTTDGYEPIYGTLQSLYHRTANLEPLDQLGREYQATYLPGIICAHTDKATMRVSIEGRSPFLDNEVMRLAAATPSSWKVRNGYGKWLVRRYIASKLPASSVPWLRKHGYTVPMAAWLRGELRPFATSLLDPDRLRAGGIFNANVVQSLFKEHLDGKVNNYKKLWPIMVFTAWAERELTNA